jgi:hypothetical protein
MVATLQSNVLSSTKRFPKIHFPHESADSTTGITEHLTDKQDPTHYQRRHGGIIHLAPRYSNCQTTTKTNIKKKIKMKNITLSSFSLKQKEER